MMAHIPALSQFSIVSKAYFIKWAFDKNTKKELKRILKRHQVDESFDIEKKAERMWQEIALIAGCENGEYIEETGKRQCLFPQENLQRAMVDISQLYFGILRAAKAADLALCVYTGEPKYDFIAADEAQNLFRAQIKFCFTSYPFTGIFCMDSLQATKV